MVSPLADFAALDFFSLLFGLFLFHYKPYYLYFIAYPMVVIGLITYGAFRKLSQISLGQTADFSYLYSREQAIRSSRQDRGRISWCAGREGSQVWPRSGHRTAQGQARFYPLSCHFFDSSGVRQFGLDSSSEDEIEREGIRSNIDAGLVANTKAFPWEIMIFFFYDAA